MVVDPSDHVDQLPQRRVAACRAVREAASKRCRAATIHSSTANHWQVCDSSLPSASSENERHGALQQRPLRGPLPATPIPGVRSDPLRLLERSASWVPCRRAQLLDTRCAHPVAAPATRLLHQHRQDQRELRCCRGLLCSSREGEERKAECRWGRQVLGPRASAEEYGYPEDVEKGRARKAVDEGMSVLVSGGIEARLTRSREADVDSQCGFAAAV